MENRVRRNKRKGRFNLITNIIFCLISLTALTGCIILLLQNYTLKNRSQEVLAQLKELEARDAKFIYSQADLDSFVEEASENGQMSGKDNILNSIKSQMSTGGTTAAMLREFFTEDVVVFSDGKYSFFPITDKLKQHNYVYDNFVVQENKEVIYTDDTKTEISRKGIDVSRYQEKINWNKVAKDGVKYAFIRAGIRGSSEGKLVEDEQFKSNIEGAAKNGIDTGVYFFTQAMTEEEAVEEAEFLLELIEPYDVTYPVVLDVEEVTSKNARTLNMTKEEYTKACIAFCERIKAAGYTPMIYGNLKTFMIMLDMEQLEQYDKWFAYYNAPVYFPYEFAVWQYTSEGAVDGIDGPVDLNISMKEW